MLYEKGLEDVISYSVVHPTWAKTKPGDDVDEHRGWVYRAPGDEPVPNPLGHGANECDEACIPDPSGCRSIREVYELAGDPTGPFMTPVLFDKKTNRIVSNESKDILRMFDGAFNAFASKPHVSLWPKDAVTDVALQTLNDEVVYPRINNGVYRSGFARSQQAYAEAAEQVFDALAQVEARLGSSRYLGGDQFTWLDLRLFHTLVRFDPVYVVYFKTNERRIADYPNLLGFLRDVYSRPAVMRTVNIKHIKTHYFTSHPHLNTYGIVPLHNGPDLTLPHGRETLSAASDDSAGASAPPCKPMLRASAAREVALLAALAALMVGLAAKRH